MIKSEIVKKVGIKKIGAQPKFARNEHWQDINTNTVLQL